MPVAHVNGIDIDYLMEGDGAETIVLINGLADDLETWGFQMGDLLAAGYRVLRFDNRGIGKSTIHRALHQPMFADDAKALVDELGITSFHMVGVSWADDRPGIRDRLRSDLKSLTLPPTRRRAVLLADVLDVGGHGAGDGVPFVMRDVTLWAFTGPFFEEREDALKEFEAAMAAMTMSVDLPRPAVRDPDPRHDRPCRLDRCRPWCSRARRTS